MSILQRFVCSAMIPYGVSDHNVTVIDYPSIAGFDSGFVADTGELIGNDDGVIHRGVIVPVRVDVISAIRLHTDQLDVRMCFLCLSDSGGKLAVKLTHRAGVEQFTVLLYRCLYCVIQFTVDILKYIPVTEPAARFFHINHNLSN